MRVTQKIINIGKRNMSVLSKDDIAEWAGVTRSTVNRFWRGETESPRIIAMICRRYGLQNLYSEYLLESKAEILKRGRELNRSSKIVFESELNRKDLSFLPRDLQAWCGYVERAA